MSTTKLKGVYLRRINRLIKALKTESAENMFNMSRWAKQPENALSPRESYRHGGNCGTSACMAGLAACIAPSFFVFQHLTDELWAITTRKDSSLTSTESFAEWLGIQWDYAIDLTEPASPLWRGKKRTDITHAINLLKAYRDGGYDQAESLLSSSPNSGGE